jgi:hypothetical protein
MHAAGRPVQDEPAGHIKEPDVMPAEGPSSVDVCTMMLSTTLAPLFPIVKPLIVILNDSSELMEAPKIVMTTEVLEVALHAAESSGTLLAPAATVGTIYGAKKFEGYVSVMVPPEGKVVLAVKLKETGTKDLPTMRSEEAMIKESDETEEKIPPDATAYDNEHMLVRNLTSEPVVFGPIVNPPMVMVNTTDADKVEPEVVITTAVDEVAPHDAVNPGTLLAPEATDGTTPDAKKLEGYRTVMTFPDTMGRTGVNWKVTETCDLPKNRSEDAIPKTQGYGMLQISESCHSNVALEINEGKEVIR